jgi:hypothetical protein
MRSRLLVKVAERPGGESNGALFTIIDIRGGIVRMGRTYYPTLVAITVGAEGVVVITPGHASHESANRYVERLLRINRRRLMQQKVVPFAPGGLADIPVGRHKRIAFTAVNGVWEQLRAELSQQALA